MKHLTAFLIVLPFILASCASTGGPDTHAPEWYKALQEGEQEDCILIKVTGRASTEAGALRQASESLFEKVIELSGTEEFYTLADDKEGLVEILVSLLEDGSQPHESIGSVKQQEAVPTSNGYNHYIAFCLKKSADEWLESRLVDQYYHSDDILQEILKLASVYEDEGKLYSAAEELVRAAAYVSGRGIPLERDMAGSYVLHAGEVLERIQIRSTSVPARTYVNRRVDPFHLYCESEETAVPSVEFLVQYQGRKRDGSPGQFERRLVSNETGIVEFYHPFIPFSGNARVSFSAGSRDFRTSLAKLDEMGLDVEVLKNWLDSNRIEHQLFVEAVDREIPTGVVILHADITGKSLFLNDTAMGIVEGLVQAGFDVELMNLDPEEINAAGESSFLRDLKATYKEEYDRVLFGVVEIDDFEARSGSYRVATSGYLKMADVDSGEILVSLEQSKSVESGNDGLAVSASFRELGKAFAQVLITALD